MVRVYKPEDLCGVEKNDPIRIAVYGIERIPQIKKNGQWVENRYSSFSCPNYPTRVVFSSFEHNIDALFEGYDIDSKVVSLLQKSGTFDGTHYKHTHYKFSNKGRWILLTNRTLHVGVGCQLEQDVANLWDRKYGSRIS